MLGTFLSCTHAGMKPHYWDPMPLDSSTGHELDLHRSVISNKYRKDEYVWVVKKFRASMKAPKLKRVLKVEIIQQPVKFQVYMKKKTLVERQNLTGTVNERFLFHGTSSTSINSIAHNGFDVGFARHGVYGCGSYFAKNASYSHDYTREDCQGNRHMYLSRVLVGIPTGGTSSTTVPPFRPDGSGLRFDSVVNNVNSPTIYVVFENDRSYPAYLITYC